VPGLIEQNRPQSPRRVAAIYFNPLVRRANGGAGCRFLGGATRRWRARSSPSGPEIFYAGRRRLPAGFAGERLEKRGPACARDRGRRRADWDHRFHGHTTEDLRPLPDPAANFIIRTGAGPIGVGGPGVEAQARCRRAGASSKRGAWRGPERGTVGRAN